MAARKRLLSIQTTINRLRGHPYLFPVGEMPGVRELVRDGVRKLLRIRNSMLTFDEAG
jgi:plasmid stabilization system protein ParE